MFLTVLVTWSCCAVLPELPKETNYFTILGIDQNADQNAIKRSFRKSAAQWHPDKYSSSEYTDDERNEANKVFKKIQEAYEFLSDAAKRNFYKNSLAKNVHDNAAKEAIRLYNQAKRNRAIALLVNQKKLIDLALQKKDYELGTEKVIEGIDLLGEKNLKTQEEQELFSSIAQYFINFIGITVSFISANMVPIRITTIAIYKNKFNLHHAHLFFKKVKEINCLDSLHSVQGWCNNSEKFPRGDAIKMILEQAFAYYWKLVGVLPQEIKNFAKNFISVKDSEQSCLRIWWGLEHIIERKTIILPGTFEAELSDAIIEFFKFHFKAIDSEDFIITDRTIFILLELFDSMNVLNAEDFEKYVHTSMSLNDEIKQNVFEKLIKAYEQWLDSRHAFKDDSNALSDLVNKLQDPISELQNPISTVREKFSELLYMVQNDKDYAIFERYALIVLHSIKRRYPLRPYLLVIYSNYEVFDYFSDNKFSGIEGYLQKESFQFVQNLFNLTHPTEVESELLRQCIANFIIGFYHGIDTKYALPAEVDKFIEKYLHEKLGLNYFKSTHFLIFDSKIGVPRRDEFIKFFHKLDVVCHQENYGEHLGFVFKEPISKFKHFLLLRNIYYNAYVPLRIGALSNILRADMPKLAQGNSYRQTPYESKTLLKLSKITAQQAVDELLDYNDDDNINSEIRQQCHSTLTTYFEKLTSLEGKKTSLFDDLKERMRDFGVDIAEEIDVVLPDETLAKSLNTLKNKLDTLREKLTELKENLNTIRNEFIPKK